MSYRQNDNDLPSFPPPPTSLAPGSSAPQIEKKYLWRGGFLLYNVLSPEECQYYISQMDKLQHESLNWMARGDAYRINDRVQVMIEDVCKQIWDRVEPYLVDGSFSKENFSIDANNNGKNTSDITSVVNRGDTMNNLVGCPVGTWKPYGLNPRVRICRYHPGGLFGRHYDGSYVRTASNRSLYTFMFYLNDDYEDGQTRFLSDKEGVASNLKQNNEGEMEVIGDDKTSDKAGDVAATVGPLKQGMLVVFPQCLYHEGTPVTKGVKYIMRTDVMFNKVEEENDVAPILDVDEEADRILKLAEELERSGQHEEAVKHYKKAFSMSKILAQQYGY